MLDTVLPWLPLAGILVTALVGAASYVYQKRIERAARMEDMRRDFYALFLDLFARVHLNLPVADTDRRDYSRARLRLFAIATEPVVRAFGRLNAELANVPPGTPIAGDRFERVRARLADLILAMRRDCFVGSSLTSELVADLLPLSPAPRPDTPPARP